MARPFVTSGLPRTLFYCARLFVAGAEFSLMIPPRCSICYPPVTCAAFWGSMIVSICAMELWLSHTSKRHTNGLGEPPAAAASVHRKAN